MRDETSGSLPAFELNYGLIPNGQLSTLRSRSTALLAALPNLVTATHRLALSTGSSKRTSRVGDRKLPSSRSSSCQPVTRAVGSEQATS